MSRYAATVEWKRKEDERFTDQKYSRAHRWRFDGGAQIEASASPSIVPRPYSEPANVDPEEAFIASLSSCHMLFFLSFAAKQGFVVDRYTDDAQGVMERDAGGRLVITVVTLLPNVTYNGRRPDRAAEEALHHAAHEACFLANSVKTRVETHIQEP